MTRFVVCPTCSGRGQTALHLGAITSAEFDELGEEFREAYVRGDLDKSCQTCKGNRVVTGCETDGCAEAPEVVTHPYYADKVVKHCYEHLTDDEKQDFEDASISWGEYRFGC